MQPIESDSIQFSNINSRSREIQHLRSELIYQSFCFFKQHGYMFIEPPILHEHIENRKGGIPVSLHNQQYDLNASNALYISAYAAMLNKVFALSPTFRDEKKTNAHLVEFTMLECESTHCDFSQCMELIRSYILFTLNKVSGSFKDSLLGNRLCSLFNTLCFDTITYKDFITNLKKYNMNINAGNDLSDYDIEVSKTLNNPTFVTDYPCPPATWTALPKGDVTYTFNLLLPGGYGELAEGGQRNNDYRLFQEKFNTAGLHSLLWYAEAVKQISSPRSGFGLGIDRLIRWFAGLESVQETVIFYREGY